LRSIDPDVPRIKTPFLLDDSSSCHPHLADPFNLYIQLKVKKLKEKSLAKGRMVDDLLLAFKGKHEAI
jgi:hypothetical protein